MAISDEMAKKITALIEALQERVNTYHYNLGTPRTNIQTINGIYDTNKANTIVTIFCDTPVGGVKNKLWYIPVQIDTKTGEMYSSTKIVGNINDEPLNLDFFDPKRVR